MKSCNGCGSIITSTEMHCPKCGSYNSDYNPKLTASGDSEDVLTFMESLLFLLKTLIPVYGWFVYFSAVFGAPRYKRSLVNFVRAQFLYSVVFYTGITMLTSLLKLSLGVIS